MKSTGPGFGTVNVVVTGLTVPSGNPGIDTFAFDALTNDSPNNPNPLLIGSTVADPGPAVTVNWPSPPGRVSVTVSEGVQTPFGVGVGVGVTVGVGVGVGVGVTVGVGVGVGVGVAVGVGVGVGPPEKHCALIFTPAARAVAVRVKSTGCPGFGIVKVAVTGACVPGANAGIVTAAFIELNTE